MAPPPRTSSELVIDLAAVRANWRRLGEHAVGAQVAAMVKADAYGLGAIPVAQALATEGCIEFFVAEVSEGIDLPGDQLIGAFVATLGLPPFDAWHEILKERLQQRFGEGYNYTYLIPGLQKVAQAAGRVIRTPDDRGVIWLIDDRFLKRPVRGLLPTWWFTNT